ncbi:MAG: hypothetical protein BWY35_00313 [Firmicutes bacterium ADurb.Bin248]|jgi:hypothetical protein|nr:MAG: hypothetical protein BWY35_00313 [Firmicutes bacterium ADurb.Bin248]
MDKFRPQRAKSISGQNAGKRNKPAMPGRPADRDPEINACRQRIPCKRDIPTPEELIAFLADEVGAKQE